MEKFTKIRDKLLPSGSKRLAIHDIALKVLMFVKHEGILALGKRILRSRSISRVYSIWDIFKTKPIEKKLTKDTRPTKKRLQPETLNVKANREEINKKLKTIKEELLNSMGFTKR